MNKYSLLALGTLSCVCAAQGTPRPAWIEVLPRRPGCLYALGVAPLGANQALALKQASQNARVELVAQLKATVQGETQLKSSTTIQKQLGGATTARAQQQVMQDTKISSQATDLPGLKVAETWVDAEGRTVYALAFMDVNQAVLELEGRLEGVRKLLGAEVDAAPVARARAIQGLKKGRAELAKLGVLAEPLMAGGGNPSLRSDIQDTGLKVDQKLTELRRSLTLALKAGPEALPGDLSAAVRSAVLKVGFGWVEGRAEFTLQVGLPQAPAGGRWWEVKPSPDFAEARATLQVTLLDAAGHPCGTSTLEAVGIGTSDAGAGQALLKDCQKRLEKALGAFLDNLAL